MLEPIKPEEFKYIETEIFETASNGEGVSLERLNYEFNQFKKIKQNINQNETFINVQGYEGEYLKLIWKHYVLNPNYFEELHSYKIELNKYKQWQESEKNHEKQNNIEQLNKQKKILINRIERIDIHLDNKTVKEIGEKKLKHLLIQKEDAQNELLDIETKLLHLGD